MNRVGTVCLVLFLLAGCVQPVSLNAPLPPVARGTDVPAVPPAQSSVQVFPLDAASDQAPDSTENLPAAIDDALVTHDPAHQRLRGVLSEQGWQLCGQATAKPMRVSAQARSALESFLLHQPMFFLDGWGRVVGNEIELVSVERMSVEGPGCREPLESFLWVAHGQKPTWAFAVTSSGMQLRVPGEPPHNYAYVAPNTDGDQISYLGPDYRLTLRRQTCNGVAKDDARYAWYAQLHTAKQQWHGCAWQGMQGLSGM